MKLKKVIAVVIALAMMLSTMSFSVFAETGNVAKVGNTEYATIDEAIAAWSSGTTLTLLADVTLSDVIKLSSTEYHILDLGTYTMTAASGKDAIQYVVNGRSSASYALDIKADATNPGGITATGKTIVSHIKPKSGAPSKDRPITRFYGGVFNASYVVKQGGSGLIVPGAGYTGASAPYFYFYGGEFNGTIYTNRSMNQFHGGTFNGSMNMSVDTSAYTLIAGGTFKNLRNSMGSELNSGKFTIGSAKGVYDKEVYIGDNGYYVIAAAEPAEGIEAAVAKTPGTNDYLAYSKVATEGALNYTDVYMALNNNKTATVTVYTDELDLTDSSFAGTIVVPEGKKEIKITVAEGTPAWTLSAGEDTVVTYVDDEGNVLEKDENGALVKPTAWTITGAEVDVQLVEGTDNSYSITLKDEETWNEGISSATMTLPAVEGASDGDMAYVVHEHNGKNYIYVGKVAEGGITFTNNVGFSIFTVNEGGLSEAIAAANAMTGDVTIEIYGKVEYTDETPDLTGAYDSINFVGKTEDAEISITRNGSNGYISGSVAANDCAVSFTDLILSKPAGYYANDAGDMNIAFTVYRVGSVAYTNCSFPNGACAAGCPTTYTGCTFKKSHDKYAFWAYGSNDIVIDSCTFDDDRGIKMYAEGAAKTTAVTVKNSDFSKLTSKPAIVLTYGDSVTLEGNTYSATGVFELDKDGAPNGTTVTADIAEIACRNDNYADCGVLVDGKIYITVTDAAAVATSGSSVTLMYDTTETVEFAEGVILDKNNHTADNVTVAAPASVAKIGDTEYATLEDAIAAAVAGDTILLLTDTEGGVFEIPADVTFNGNGFAVNGTLYALGDITFAGHTKITKFDFENVGTEINIGPGACLEITGTGRMVIGHGCTFNITGNITDAKTANKADITPSLIAAGASFTGAGLNFNVTNAYVKFTAYCSSKNNSASSTFNINVNNSIWEQTGSLVFSEPTNGKDPTFNFNVKDSVIDSTSHLVFAVTKGEIVFDNSNVNVNNCRQLENRSTLTIKNGSVVYAAHATSSNAKNPGTTIVENATYVATGEFTGSDIGTGTLTLKKGANVTMGKITKANIVVDATGMVAGDVVGLTANLSALTGTLSVINNDALKANIVDGNIVLVVKPVAKIGDTEYATLEDAIAAAVAGDTITLMSDATLDSSVTIKKSVTIDGNGYTVKQSEGCNNAIALLYFEGSESNVLDVVVNNLTFDGIKVGAAIRTLCVNMTIDNCTFKNCEHTQIQGLVRLTQGTATVKNSKFLNNNCSMGISFNYDTAGFATDVFTLENCEFTGNTANSTALVYYVKGAGCEIKDSEFVNNTVNCNTNGATIYLGFQEDCVVTGNIFENNNVVDSSDSTRVGGAIFFGYEADISGNVFVNNTASNATGDTLGQICTSTYYDCEINVNGNYWGGEAPVYGKDYTVQHQTGEATFKLDTYNNSYVVDESGKVVVGDEVSIEYVAQVGKFGYTTLKDAIANANDKTVVVLSDIALDATVKIPAGLEVTLDLNGKTITGTDKNTTGNFYLINNCGTLTVTGNGTITLVAETNRAWNSSSVVIATNPGGKLVVENGNIEHLGGTDMAYALDNLTNGKGTYAETVINGGTIKSTYRAVRQFLNGVEAQNILTINGGVVEGANKAIFFHDPSAKANSGTLTVTENATVNGDIYLYVTEGSAEWPVEVSIAASAVTGEVLSKNVPAGYKVAEINGAYGVIEFTAVAKIGDTEYATLEEAFAAAVNGDTVTLVEDIAIDVDKDGVIKVSDNKALTLDLNGKVITATDTLASGDASLFHIGANTTDGTLTVKDTVGTGAIKLTSETDRDWNAASRIFHNRGGVLNIESGTFEHLGGTDMAFVVDNSANSYGDATTNISGGNLSSTYIAIRNRMDTYGANGGGNGVAILNVTNGNIYGYKRGIWGHVSSKGVKGGLNISGGTVTSVQQDAIVYDADETGEYTFNVTGGTFSSDVSAFVAEGYEVKANSDGTYGIQEKVEEVKPFKDAPLFIAGLDDITYEGKKYHPIYIATSVDSLNYRKVGFDFTFQIFDPETGEVTFTAEPISTETRNVYSEIIVSGEPYTVESIGGNGAHLFMDKVYFDVENYHNNNTKFSITPYAIDMDGNKIAGWTLNMTNEYFRELQPDGTIKKDMFKEEAANE